MPQAFTVVSVHTLTRRPPAQCHFLFIFCAYFAGWLIFARSRPYMPACCSWLRCLCEPFWWKFISIDFNRNKLSAFAFHVDSAASPVHVNNARTCVCVFMCMCMCPLPPLLLLLLSPPSRQPVRPSKRFAFCFDFVFSVSFSIKFMLFVLFLVFAFCTLPFYWRSCLCSRCCCLCCCFSCRNLWQLPMLLALKSK